MATPDDLQRPGLNRRFPIIPGFTIKSVLGAGGGGTVYLACDLQGDRSVALKVVRHLDEVGRARFEREAGLHLGLRHSSIARAFQWGIQDHVGWISFELLKGADLSQHVGDRQIGVFRRFEILIQIARALHYGHEKGVIHRDVKPSNIFLRSDGGICLLDFGVAKVSDKPLTATGGLVGTPAYMAPEYILESTVDHRVDIFGLGVVAFQLFTGQCPWSAHEAHTLLVRICTTPPKRFEELFEWAPVVIPDSMVEPLGALIHLTLAHDPSRRPASAEQLASYFEDIMLGKPFDDGYQGSRSPETTGFRRLAWARARAARIQLEARFSRGPAEPALTSGRTERVDIVGPAHRVFWWTLLGLIAALVTIGLVALYLASIV